MDRSVGGGVVGLQLVAAVRRLRSAGDGRFDVVAVGECCCWRCFGSFGFVELVGGVGVFGLLVRGDLNVDMLLLLLLLLLGLGLVVVDAVGGR